MEDVETAEVLGATMVVATTVVSGLSSCCSSVADVAETHLVDVASIVALIRRGMFLPSSYLFFYHFWLKLGIQNRLF